AACRCGQRAAPAPLPGKSWGPQLSAGWRLPARLEFSLFRRFSIWSRNGRAPARSEPQGACPQSPRRRLEIEMNFARHSAVRTSERHMKKLASVMFAILLSGFVVGCKVGPNYRRPTVQTPTEHRELKDRPQAQVAG